MMFGSITLNQGSRRRHQSEGSRCGTSPGSKGGMASDPVGEEPYAEDEPGSEPSVEVVKVGRSFELRSVLELIRDHNAVLGTAHRTGGDFTVVEAARDMGSKNIVVTHPEWHGGLLTRTPVMETARISFAATMVKL